MPDDKSGAIQPVPEETDDVSEVPPEPIVRERSIPGEISESDVRAKLAYALGGMYAGTIFLSFVAVGFFNSAEIRQLIQNLIAAETGLFGTVLGFYFGGKANRR